MACNKDTNDHHDQRELMTLVERVGSGTCSSRSSTVISMNP